MTACGMNPCATAHSAVQYSVASPPLCQTQPLWGVSKASHATVASSTAVSVRSSGTGRTATSPKRARARRSDSGTCMREAVLAVPADRPCETLAQRRARAEAEESLGARCVELPARLPVRHRRVPHDLSAETGQIGDRLRELADRRFDARAEVHRLPAVVALRGQQEALGAILDVQELACR